LKKFFYYVIIKIAYIIANKKRFGFSFGVYEKIRERKKLLQSSLLLSETEALQMNPVALAFLGDAVYSLWVRERLVKNGAGDIASYQRFASTVESARGQNGLLERILPLFTERETEIFKRGRNAKKATKSKSASVAEYNRSTGLEAVLGFLYLTGNYARVDELLSYMDEVKGASAPTAYKP